MEENHLRNGHSFVGKIASVIKADPDFPLKIKQRLLIESHQVTNPFQLISSLFSKGVLDDRSNDPEEIFALKDMIVQLAIRIACSRGPDAIVGLVETLEEKENSYFKVAIRTWFNENYGSEYNGDLSESEKVGAVVGAPRPEVLRKEMKQQIKETSTFLGPDFFHPVVPSNELLKVATFTGQPETSANGTYALHLDEKGMMAGFAGGTVKMWNWLTNKEQAFKCGTFSIRCLQYDEEIIVLGSSNGIVYLYDAVTLEEKWSVRFGGSVDSLRFFESTLVVFAGTWNDTKLWWLDISRSDMRLFNRRTIGSSKWVGERKRGALIDSDYCFFRLKNSVYLYDTKSGFSITDAEGNFSCFSAPADINTLKLIDLISTKRILTAGCVNGSIVMWNTCGVISANQNPVKTFKRCSQGICYLFNINEHLVSVDEKSTVLMWSGHDLENANVMMPVPRVLDNFPKFTCLAEHKRWFACGTSTDVIIDIWTLPDLWLRTG